MKRQYSVDLVVDLLKCGDLFLDDLAGSKFKHRSRGLGAVTPSKRGAFLQFRDSELNLDGHKVANLSGWESISLTPEAQAAVSLALSDEFRIEREELIRRQHTRAKYLNRASVRKIYEKGLISDLEAATNCLETKGIPPFSRAAAIIKALEDCKEYKYLARLLYRFPGASQSLIEGARISSLFRKSGEPHLALKVSNFVEKDPKLEKSHQAKSIWTSRAAAFCDLGKYADADRCIRIALALAGKSKSDQIIFSTYQRIQSHL